MKFNPDIINAIKTHEEIAIVGHINPDGDAIGACLALALSLSKLNKKPVVFLEPFGEQYDFLPGHSYIQQDFYESEISCWIALDSGDEGRVGEAFVDYHKAPCTINIDHHKSNTLYGMYNHVDEKASSTSEIIYNLMEELDIELDQDIAICLYTGIIYDTGGFKHSSTGAAAHNAAARLISYGFNFSDIHHELFSARTYTNVRFLGKAIENIEFYHNGQVAFTSIDLEEINRLGGDYKELEGIISFVKDISGVSVAIFLYEKEKQDIKASFRSDGAIDVCKLAAAFGGGGHKKASGCSFTTTMSEAKNAIIEHIRQELTKEV